VILKDIFAISDFFRLTILELIKQMSEKGKKLKGIGLEEIASLDLTDKAVTVILAENPEYIQKQLRWRGLILVNEFCAKDLYSREDLKELNLEPNAVILSAFDKENNKLLYLRPYLEFEDGTRGY